MTKQHQLLVTLLLCNAVAMEVCNVKPCVFPIVNVPRIAHSAVPVAAMNHQAAGLVAVRSNLAVSEFLH